MTTFITLAARAFLAAVDSGDIRPDLEDWDASQVEALRDELDTTTTTPTSLHHRAERGRLSVQLFGMNDDNETVAADVIADILHWVSINGSEQSAGAAHFRAARYYGEDRD